MKTFKYFSMMLAMLVCSIGFVSCSSDDDDDDDTNTTNETVVKSIYGTWTQTNDYGYVIKITFNTDGTGRFSVTDEEGESTTGSFEFDYNEEEKEITILSNNSWAQRNLTGEWDVVVTPSTLQLKGYSNGSYVVYQLKRK